MTRTDGTRFFGLPVPPIVGPTLATVAVALLCVPGCGPPAAKLVPAEGTLTIAGKPAGDIALQFLPEDLEGERRPTSFAVTDAEGRFRLTTYEGQEGAVEGIHTVLIVDTLEERPAQGEVAAKPPRVDPRHSTMTGGIRCQIAAGGGPITLELP